jgi:pimeloyl-ACP methyl ester carboxylesterase
MPWHGPDGHRLHYEDTGRGDTVVVMPGWAGSIIKLSQLRAALLPGFRVIAVDLPGSGRSQPQPRSYEAGYYRDDARAVGARIMTRSWAQAMRDLVAAGGDISRDRAHLITCPALLVAGTYDPHCPPDLTRELAALIPKGQFLEAPGAGHAVHLSHTAWLAGQLTNWLASH